MTPAARYAAAIDILDKMLAGEAAEKALTNWARSNRFAGSGDRHALRDIVYDVLRCKRSFAAIGGAHTGRGLVLGGLRAANIDPETVFTGVGYAPASLSAEESAGSPVLTELEALDCPDWLAPELRRSLGGYFEPILRSLQSRAPIFLRANLRKTTRAGAQQSLLSEGIVTQPIALSKTALEVHENPRKVQTSNSFLTGLIELQDAASQAIVDMLPLTPQMRVLDYCAGGGGKSLAMAGVCKAQFFAHDINPSRMKDLPARAKRAGVKVETLATSGLTKVGGFDLVLADAPCSGSGSWRRAPEAKWALTPERLADLLAIQADVMDKASALVSPNGIFAYATCSLLHSENGDQVAAFLARHGNWFIVSQHTFTPLDGGDGFFATTLKRVD
ncbi:RsmB/NOP family class I SAM-dependent RNA methyltransferase [Pseudorhodobacter ferrugineus]|uniref:RsmB/NOP family class I SAM-dependent RNA methyltransferase n=1 Tax=Pseudorhodobacter ferrugineus TaxID=77008 RepID=UPI0003B480A0|nr:RsmB/NOP family class I SAM-dependent RNA methyltransferase [Pseudorhodobacter ferrugineus]